MFSFECVHSGPRYALYEAKVHGRLIGVVLNTTDKDNEEWFETRITAKGYEEREVWEAFDKWRPRVGEGALDRP